MNRPYTDMKLNKRDAVWYWRRQAAWDLVHHKFDEVTEDEYDRAFDLLAKCIRYALASHRLFESEDELNVNDPWRKRKEDQLMRRYDRLNNELAYYDARMTGDVYPQVADIDRRVNDIICRLHCFE